MPTTASSANLLASIFDLSPLALVFSILVALTIPLLLHLLIYRTASNSSLPSFLLVGPSGSGKTSLQTLLERGHRPAATHTSQAPLGVEISLPVSTPTASSKHRSSSDPALQTHKRFLLLDTPGHGKLRHHAVSALTAPSTHLKGLVFVVDAAGLAANSVSLRSAAEYLHDLLVLLQRRATRSRTARAPSPMPVLVAANKTDLFTALPAAMVRSVLAAEITAVRASRSKSLLDSGVGMDEAVAGDEEREWLGEGGDGPFDFGQMEEFGVQVAVEGGSVVGAEGPDVGRWWAWIGENL